MVSADYMIMTTMATLLLNEIADTKLLKLELLSERRAIGSLQKIMPLLSLKSDELIAYFKVNVLYRK